MINTQLSIAPYYFFVDARYIVLAPGRTRANGRSHDGISDARSKPAVPPHGPNRRRAPAGLSTSEAVYLRITSGLYQDQCGGAHKWAPDRHVKRQTSRRVGAPTPHAHGALMRSSLAFLTNLARASSSRTGRGSATWAKGAPSTLTSSAPLATRTYAGGSLGPRGAAEAPRDACSMAQLAVRVRVKVRVRV